MCRLFSAFSMISTCTVAGAKAVFMQLAAIKSFCQLPIQRADRASIRLKVRAGQVSSST